MLLKGIFLTGSYSNQIFPDPLTKEEEDYCIKQMMLGDTNSRNKLIESKYVDQDDLISIGTIGLIKGVDTFSNDKGVRITTYCARCIENEVLMYFRSNNKTTKNISINESIGYDKDGNEISIMDVLKAPKPDFVEEISLKENIALLNEYMSVLTEREKEILIRRYGLLNRDEQTQKEIAKELKISRSYVSRIEKRALTKILREFIKNNKYDEV